LMSFIVYTLSSVEILDDIMPAHPTLTCAHVSVVRFG
jgi:hypothetical protein